MSNKVLVAMYNGKRGNDISLYHYDVTGLSLLDLYCLTSGKVLTCSRAEHFIDTSIEKLNVPSFLFVTACDSRLMIRDYGDYEYEDQKYINTQFLAFVEFLLEKTDLRHSVLETIQASEFNVINTDRMCGFYNYNS